MVRMSVEIAFSRGLRTLVSRAQDGFLNAYLGGAAAAVMLQSATAVILLTTAFINGGILSHTTAIVVVLGADLGSAIAARILFLDLSYLPPLCLACGVAIYRLSRTHRRQQAGRALIGLGLILTSINLLKSTILPLADSGFPPYLLELLNNLPWVGVLVAGMVTWLAHSSVAVVLIIATLAQADLMPLSVSLPLLLGANIGSGLITVLLANHAHAESYCIPIANLLLRVALGIALLFLMLLMPPLEWLAYVGKGEQVIYLHIMFNLLLGMLACPWRNWIAHTALEFVKNRALTETKSAQSPGQALDSELISTPELAIASARIEALRLADNTQTLLDQAMQLLDATDRSEVDLLVKSDQEINQRNKMIHRYLSEVRHATLQQNATAQQRHSLEIDNIASEHEKAVEQILKFSMAMENIGDLVAHDIARLAIKRLERESQFSTIGRQELTTLHTDVARLLKLETNDWAVEYRWENPHRKALIKAIRQQGKISYSNHWLRLSQREVSSLESSTIHLDLVRDLMQIAEYVAGIED